MFNKNILLTSNNFFGPLEQFDVYWVSKQANFLFGNITNLGLSFWVNIITILSILVFILYDLNKPKAALGRVIYRDWYVDNSNVQNPVFSGSIVDRGAEEFLKIVGDTFDRSSQMVDSVNTSRSINKASIVRNLFNKLIKTISLQLNNYFSSTGPYPYKALLLAVFLEIVFLNYLGLFPNNEGLTSTFVLPFFLAFLFIGIAFLIKYYRYGIQAWSFFVPSAPLLLLGLIATVEIISYAIKLVSLSGRLFANIFSGHVLLAILSGAVFTFFTDISTVLLGVMGPALIILCVFCLEFFIAFLQAYVFANLGAMYLGDVIVRSEH